VLKAATGKRIICNRHGKKELNKREGGRKDETKEKTEKEKIKVIEGR
jgi:hypothetical protein